MQTVLILIDHYLPGYLAGGPTRTIANLVEWLGDDINLQVLTKDRDLGSCTPYPGLQPGKWHAVGKALVRYLAPEERGPQGLLKVLQTTSYELIYLNTVFSTWTVIILALARLGWTQSPIIVAARGNLSSSALSLKSTKKRIFLTAARLLGLYDNVHWHATSDEEYQDIQNVFGSRIRQHITRIPNLPAPLGEYRLHGSKKTSGDASMVIVSRITRMKNLEFIADTLDRVIGNVSLDLWGPIEDDAYWQICLKRFQELPPNIRIQYRGVVLPAQVTEILSKYDLFFMPSLSENFGHAILESLSAGCPVLISDRTPWNDIEARGAGWAISLDEPEKFRDVVQSIVDADANTIESFRNSARTYAVDYSLRSSAVKDMYQFLTSLSVTHGTDQHR